MLFLSTLSFSNYVILEVFKKYLRASSSVSFFPLHFQIIVFSRDVNVLKQFEISQRSRFEILSILRDGSF